MIGSLTRLDQAGTRVTRTQRRRLRPTQDQTTTITKPAETEAANLMTNALIDYHARAAHTFASFAASNSVSFNLQPDPTRRFEGDETEIFELTLDPQLPSRTSCEFDKESISDLFLNSLALSGRRGRETGYDIRTTPSSGNLHSEECYVFVPDHLFDTHSSSNQLSVYHYQADRHILQKRGELSSTYSLPEQPSGILLLFTHIPLRQSWKYGVRGLKYSLLDSGHAISAAAHAASSLGWTAWASTNVPLPLLSVSNPGEREEAACLVWIEKEGQTAAIALSSPSLDWTLQSLHSGTVRYLGIANKLAKSDLVVYPELEAALDALQPKKSGTDSMVSWHRISTVTSTIVPFLDPPVPESFGHLARNRRSAQDFHSANPPFVLNADGFLGFLNSLVPLARSFSSEEAAVPAIAVLLNHTLDHLPRGLYLLWLGEPAGVSQLKEETVVEWDWRQVDSAGRVFLLSEGWVERVGGAVCCMQTLASKALFNIHLIHPLPLTTRETYLSAHFTAAHLVHAVYLLAHGRGLGCSGMGCFIDSGVPSLLGLATEDMISEKLRGFLKTSEGPRKVRGKPVREWSVVYTAGVGDPMFDERLTLDSSTVYDKERDRRRRAVN